MAQEWWINTTGSTWKKVTEAYVNTTGSTWKEITEAYVNTTGSTWKQYYAKTAPDPSFDSSSFLADSDADEDGFSDNRNCDCESAGPKYQNGYCIKWTISNCVGANHDVRVQQNTGSGWFNESNAINCTAGGIGWCSSSGVSGAVASGTFGTSVCPTVTDDFRVIVEPAGGGADYDVTPSTNGWNLGTCAAA